MCAVRKFNVLVTYILNSHVFYSKLEMECAVCGSPKQSPIEVQYISVMAWLYFMFAYSTKFGQLIQQQQIEYEQYCNCM